MSLTYWKCEIVRYAQWIRISAEKDSYITFPEAVDKMEHTTKKYRETK